MDVAWLLAELAAPEKRLNLWHVVIQDWIVFHRNRFDHFDADGHPYLTQSFLIEVSTGKYIHRAQGQNIDWGTVLDLNLIPSKLRQVFEEGWVCQGFPTRDIHGNNRNFKTLDYPYKRRVAHGCQTYFPKDDCKTEAPGSYICPACREAWHQLTLKPTSAHFDLKLEGLKSEEAEEEQEAAHAQFPPADFVDVGLTELKDNHEHVVDDGDVDLSFESEEEFQIRPKKRQRTTRKKTKAKKEPQTDLIVVSGSGDLEDDKRIYSCNHCSETFSSLHNYHKHQRDKRRVGCPECCEDIVTFNQLVKHAFDYHAVTAPNYLKYVQDEEEEKSMKVPRKCLMCDMVYNGMVLLHRHKELYHELGDYRCDECQQPCLTYYDLMIHQYQSHSKAVPRLQPHTHGVDTIQHKDGKVEKKRTLFVCPHCQASYKADSRWTVHMRTKHSWGLFECKPCDEVCHYASDFSSHMINFHPDNSDVKCPSCSKLVSLKEDPEAFNVHYQDCPYDSAKAVNEYEKKNTLYQCDYCGKNYFSKNSFDAHIKQHQGIERFKCTQCDYGTNYKGVLLDHQKMHLREQGLTNADSELVLFHQCDQCGKQYSNIQGLRDHIKRVHQGIKPSFPCKDCGRTFTNKASLYNHKKREHGFVSTQTKKGRRPLT
ncbi:hypothetical protein TCAL_06268 [Tigriopus californicus]|uniref:C2H2-type domain-containing protein n=1 Tax=Tigriopus californicus TaxID=6832 RepID=A0A553NCK6_TIGCA|nr:zinc finger protein 57-like [Tigriopus californicus]TRY63089.1 hypothetical protein TCAL_06268 [Tigriopus californicus]|eukprot:TCALIF_06268-PA protein Name:"Similar to Zfp28 Zinc finger protein 28 (Mus musculus)" AED:0.14 eAED:0.15 QI:0/-1/0/1/-1/1/1/0/650